MSFFQITNGFKIRNKRNSGSDYSWINEKSWEWENGQNNLIVIQTDGVKNLCIAGGQNTEFQAVEIEVWGIQ